jgi:hypothetical protein
MPSGKISIASRARNWPRDKIVTKMEIGHEPEHQAPQEERHLATILIAYDIHPTTSPRFHDLAEAIQSLGAWWHHLETVWIVRSSKSPDAIREQLQVLVGSDDQLLVIDITGARVGWAGVNDTGSRWLAENIAKFS